MLKDLRRSRTTLTIFIFSKRRHAVVVEGIVSIEIPRKKRQWKVHSALTDLTDSKSEPRVGAGDRSWGTEGGG
jgi:hypothetical protein